MTTAGFMMQFLRLGLITVQEADDAKILIARNHYTMSFASFSELWIGVTGAVDGRQPGL